MKIDRDETLRRTEAFVRERMSGEGTGHDWWHVHRVRRMALRLAGEEGADVYVVELAALLHDVADHKFHGGDATAGPRAAREWLGGLEADPEVTEHVAGIIAGLSFKGAGVPTPMSTVEGRVVQDADRLDAIGARAWGAPSPTGAAAAGRCTSRRSSPRCTPASSGTRTARAPPRATSTKSCSCSATG
jgi:uncharacterized protein